MFLGKKGAQVTRTKGSATSRRDFLKLAAGAAACGPFFLFPERAHASQKTLKVAKWAHFLPEFDQWFVNVLAQDWGKQNDTRVTVDVIPVEEIRGRAFAEVKAGKGHDLFIFPWPPAEFHQHVIDHGEVYQAVASRYGSIQQLAHRSTFDFRTKTYFAFADFWVPSPLHFFQDYWGQIGMPLGPVHYGSLLGGGKKLRDQLGIPCGLSFSPTLEGNVTLHTILYAFRAWILDGNGSVQGRSEEHTSELQSRQYLVCRLLLEKKKNYTAMVFNHDDDHILPPLSTVPAQVTTGHDRQRTRITGFYAYRHCTIHATGGPRPEPAT